MKRGFESDSRSVFNEGVNQIERIGSSLRRCAHYSKNGILDKWRWELDSLYRELSFDAKDKNFEDSLKEKDILIAIAFRRGLRGLMYRFLDEKERLLRELQEESGKGGSYQSFDDSDFLG